MYYSSFSLIKKNASRTTAKLFHIFAAGLYRLYCAEHKENNSGAVAYSAVRPATGCIIFMRRLQRRKIGIGFIYLRYKSQGNILNGSAVFLVIHTTV